MHGISREHSTVLLDVLCLPQHPTRLPLPHLTNQSGMWCFLMGEWKCNFLLHNTNQKEYRLARGQRPREWRGYLSSMWLGLLWEEAFLWRVGACQVGFQVRLLAEEVVESPGTWPLAASPQRRAREGQLQVRGRLDGENTREGTR